MIKTRTFWKLFLWANLLLILYFWAQGNSGLFTSGLASGLISFGRLAGLLAVYAVLVQFFFMGRTPYLERAFGLDKLARYHHTNGKLAYLFILLHPVLLIWGYGKVSGTNYISQAWIFITQYEDVLAASAAFLLFTVVVFTSIYLARKHFRYESWYFVHLLVYVAIMLSFGHQLSVGTDLIASKIFYGYWLALYIFVFGNHIAFRFLRPLYNFYQHRFWVDRIVRESSHTVSIYIRGKDLEKFKIQPGQFMIFRFLDKKRWWQAHPFSLSMLPNGKEIRITSKQVGDFTNTIPNLKPGTKVFIDGPYGVFTNFFSVSSKVLFIAGGIGITPIRSLMEEMLQKGKDIVLIYGNRNTQDLVFKEELDTLTDKYGGQIHYIISDQPDYPGEKGRITTDTMEKLVPDYKSREVYLCGPTPMMDSLLAILKKQGITDERLHFEKFSLQ